MKIQIRQPEIEEALRDYVAKQGINMTGRHIAIVFTSGRKNNGLTADLDISDAPDTAPIVVPQAEAAPVPQEAEDPPFGADPAEEADPVVEASEAKAATTSLFS